MLYSILVKRYITEHMLKFLIRDVLGEHDKRIFAKKFCREFGGTLSIDIILPIIVCWNRPGNLVIVRSIICFATHIA